MKSPVKIIYICGAGRSGSTLLDIILGSQAGYFSIGQFHATHFSPPPPHDHCSCGALREECAFWAPFFGRFSVEIEDIRNNPREDPYFLMGDRFREFLAVLRYGTSGRLPTVDDKFIERQRSMLSYIIEESGANCLSDSSKKPMRLLALLSSPVFDTYFIYLYRDSLGFMHSKRKAKSKRKAGRLLSILSWSYMNILSMLIYRRVAPQNKAKLSLQQLLDNPRMELDRVLSHFGMETDFPTGQILFIDPARNHIISGNKIRLEGEKAVRPLDRPRSTDKVDLLLDRLIGQPVQRLIRRIH